MRCPMQVPGTTARAEDTEGGVAIAFTTTGDAGEVRERVRAMAAMHHEHHDGKCGMTMGGGGAGGMGNGMQMGHGMMGAAGSGMMGHGMMGHGMMVAADARAEDVEGGARVVFTPKDPADLERLREHAREHVSMLESGHCPMMHADAHAAH